MLGFGDAEFRARWERDRDRATLSDVKNCIALLLNSRELEPSQIAVLASRRCYQFSVAVLMRGVGFDEVELASLVKPVAARVAAFRAARTFDVVGRADESIPVTVESLRGLLPLENAACALAALGHINWRTEKRPRPRLVFILRELIGMARS